MRLRVLGALLWFTLTFAWPSSVVRASQRESELLHQLFRREWDHLLEQNPTFASSLGDRRWNDRWEDASLENLERQQTHRRTVLRQLLKIQRAKLKADDQLNYDLFRRQYETDAAEFGFQWYLIPLNQREGVQTLDELADALRFETLKDYEDWVSRLERLPEYITQIQRLLAKGLETKMVLPKVIVQRIPAQIEKQITGAPETSPFYRPLRNFPESVSVEAGERLRERARQAIGTGVIPAYRKLREFMVGEYLPGGLDRVGAWQLPRGDQMYAFFANKYTTTSLTPQEIHELGLKEVQRIRSQMEQIMKQVGFAGALPDFFQRLRTDPQFYFRTGEELLAGYRSISKRVDPTLVKLFGYLPRIPYGVEPIPDKIAPDTTTAYYRQPAADGSRAGTYFVNLYRPETRPKYEMMALSLHEAVPGHHLQIAVAMEQGAIPNFRRYGSFTAFVEGWGLYAESLGDELGLYDDAYSKFGQLTYEMWRAVRLVVDTGIHAFQWDRQKAIDFFLANAAKTELDVVNEIDRYIAWPGQALAYKVGELKIKELRARAQQRLGNRFEVRAFHDALLGAGALPLDLLETRLNAWMTQQTVR